MMRLIGRTVPYQAKLLEAHRVMETKGMAFIIDITFDVWNSSCLEDSLYPGGRRKRS